jgi:hypothetical protein
MGTILFINVEPGSILWNIKHKKFLLILKVGEKKICTLQKFFLRGVDSAGQAASAVSMPPGKRLQRCQC